MPWVSLLSRPVFSKASGPDGVRPIGQDRVQCRQRAASAGPPLMAGRSAAMLAFRRFIRNFSQRSGNARSDPPPPARPAPPGLLLRQRIAAERGTVVARMEDAHHPIVGKAERGRPPPRVLPRMIPSGGPFVLAGQQPPGATESGLDLVGDEQHVVAPASGAAQAARNPGGGRTMPPSPWIGSTRKEPYSA